MSQNPTLRFALRFALAFVVADVVYLAATAQPWWATFIALCVAKPSGVVINLLGAQHVLAVGSALHGQQVTLNIQSGCDGVEAFLILFAGIVASRSGLYAKSIAVLVASVLILSINTLRIAALFFTKLSIPAYFDLVHSVIGPMFIVGTGMAAFWLWMTRQSVL